MIQLQHDDLSVLWVIKHLNEKISIKKMAESLNYAPSYLGQLFQIEKDMHIHEYINSSKIKHAQSLMIDTDLSLDAICEYLGFSDIHYFCRVFKKIAGIPPGKFRSQIIKAPNKGISIENNFRTLEQYVIR